MWKYENYRTYTVYFNPRITPHTTVCRGVSFVDKISLWCTANKLSLSPDKTCYSIFGNYSHTGNIKPS